MSKKDRRRVERRSAFPRDEPNGQPPPPVEPGTVGPEVYQSGEAGGIDLVVEPASSRPFGSGPPKPQPWSGWPADWDTPSWFGRAEELADTAWACLDLNSSVLASMPPYLVGAAPSLGADWLNNPDPDRYTGWCEFARQLFWDYQGVGEAFVLATAWYYPGRYDGGWPARFHVVPPWMVGAEIDGDGRRRYTIGGQDVTDEILHVRYKSTTADARGHGPLEVGYGRLVAARLMARYATDLVAAGGIPHSLIIYPGRLTAEQRAELQFEWVTNRLAAMGMPGVLSGGVDFRTLSFNVEQMAMVDLARFNEARIAVMLRVPPFLVALPTGADSLTYTNINSLFDYHWRATLRTMTRPVMEALSEWSLPRGTDVELNADEYVQPGPKERAETAAIWHGITDPEGRPALAVGQMRRQERFTEIDRAPATPDPPPAELQEATP